MARFPHSRRAAGDRRHRLWGQLRPRERGGPGRTGSRTAASLDLRRVRGKAARGQEWQLLLAGGRGHQHMCERWCLGGLRRRADSAGEERGRSRRSRPERGALRGAGSLRK